VGWWRWPPTLGLTCWVGPPCHSLRTAPSCLPSRMRLHAVSTENLLPSKLESVPSCSMGIDELQPTGLPQSLRLTILAISPIISNTGVMFVLVALGGGAAAFAATSWIPFTTVTGLPSLHCLILLRQTMPLDASRRDEATSMVRSRIWALGEGLKNFS
jgi:hypothetical protein